MPEGFNSLEDLKVVITAQTDNLSSGLQSARSLVSRFASEGNTGLKSFDGALEAVGTRVQWLQTRMLPWLGVIMSVVSAYQQFKEVGAGLAEQAGVKDEFDELTGSFDHLGASVTRVLSYLKDEGPSKAGEFAIAAANLASSVGDVERRFSFVSAAMADELTPALEDTNQEFERTDPAASRAAKAVEAYAESLNIAIRKQSEAPGLLEQTRNVLTRMANSIGDVMQGFLPADARSVQTLERTILWTVAEIERLEALVKKAGGESEAWWDKLLGTVSVNGGGDATRDAIDRLRTALQALIPALSAAREAAARGIGSWDTEVLESAEKLTTAMQRRIRDLHDEAQALTLNGRAKIEYLAVRRIEKEVEDGQIAATKERLEALRAQAREEASLRFAIDERKKAESQAKSDDRTVTQVLDGMERQTLALVAQARQYYMTAGEAAKLKAEEQALQQLQQRNIAISPELLQKIDENARAYANAAEQAKALQDQMKAMQEVGQVVSRSLSSAFDQWMKGTEVNGREMVASLLRELAKLTLMQTVLQPLFGGGSTQGGGAFGNLLAGLFTPARQGGGRVTAGYPYQVNEKRQELFVPDSPGRVLPDVSQVAKSPVHVTINMPINAQGAYPESIEDIKRAVAGVEASIPSRVVETVMDARERNVI